MPINTPAPIYLASLLYRCNGKFDRIPNYVIKKNGDILQLLENIEHTNYINEPNINRNGIIISLENLGWLEKQPLENYYVNWIGDIYKGIPYERKWRDYFFWDSYTDEQINSLIELCKKITMEMSIKYKFIGHNTKSTSVENYEGITSRSNYNSFYSDLSPSFPFSTFIKKLEYEN